MINARINKNDVVSKTAINHHLNTSALQRVNALHKSFNENLIVLFEYVDESIKDTFRLVLHSEIEGRCQSITFRYGFLSTPYEINVAYRLNSESYERKAQLLNEIEGVSFYSALGLMIDEAYSMIENMDDDFLLRFYDKAMIYLDEEIVSMFGCLKQDEDC